MSFSLNDEYIVYESRALEYRILRRESNGRYVDYLTADSVLKAMAVAKVLNESRRGE